MLRTLAVLACLLALAPSGRAQIDLPDRPVRPQGSGAPVELPPVQRGDLARKARGELPQVGGAGALPELPAEARAADPPLTPAPPAIASAPDGALATAARFIFDEVRKARSVDERIVLQAVSSLSSLGGEGRAAARAALADDHPPTLLVAARVLLASGEETDAEQVLARLRGRVPNAACGPLLDALVEVDPVRAPPAFLAELLSHPQGAVRAAAQRHLAQIPPSALVEALPPVLEARLSDARLRAVVLLAGCSDPRALELLATRLADPSADVARRVVEAFAISSDERVPAELLRRAFDGRWILRGNAYALLALVEREDLRFEALLGPQHVDALIGGLSSSDAFVSAVSAAALAGVGYRSQGAQADSWLDREVPERLVVAVSGREFHNDFSALQPAALRRLALLSGESLGTDGPRWVDWWVAKGPNFHARRAALPIAAEEAGSLRVDLLSSVEGELSFRLLGAAEDAGAGIPAIPRTLFLTAAQGAELLEVLRREGILGPERLPGARGSGARGARTLEIAVRGRSKVFCFAEGAGEPWFQRAVATVQALAQRNRWQLYPMPGAEVGAREAFLREGEWWDGPRSDLERDLRLKERLLAALPARPPSQRDEGVRELERIGAGEGRLVPADLEPLLALLREERFQGPRATALVTLALRAGREDGQVAVPPTAGARIIDTLFESFGPAGADELARVLEALGPQGVRAAAADGRPLLRAVSASLLARQGGEQDVALLIELLGDPDPEVELAAVRAVGTGRVEAARTEVLVRARVAQGALRAAALEATGELGGENALDVLLIGVSEPDLAIALGAARGLAALADPSTAALFVTLLARSGDDPLVAPARSGLLALGERAWPDLLRAVNTPGSRARREAALLLSMQGVPQAAPALMRALDAAPQDARVAAELAVLTGVDLREQADPPGAWWSWWTGVVHDDALAWFLAALEREGLPPPPPSAFASSGTAEGAAFLASLLELAPPHLSERARRELGRLLGRDLGPPPSAEPQFEAWVAALQAEVGARTW